MCIISCILKVPIIFVNSWMIIMGSILMVIGALLLWGMNFILRNVYDLQTEAKRFLIQFDIHADASGIISLIQQNSSSIGVISFGIGIFLIALGILGIIIICCCSLKRILVVICGVLVVITLCLLIFIIYFGSDNSKIFNPLLANLQNNIINKYQDINSTQPESIFVNLVQIVAGCCGLYNYTDFNTAVNFNRKVVDSYGKVYILAFPLSCCDYKNNFTISQEVRDNCIQTNISKNMNNGCWDSQKQYLIKYLNYCFLTTWITIAILIAAIIVTVLLIKCAEKFE